MPDHAGVEFENVQLNTDRIRLRPWRPEDAPAVHAALEPAWMRRYLATAPSPYTLEDAESFVADFAHRAQAAGSGLEMAIADLATDEVLGSAAIRLPLGQLRSADIGYWVAPAHQGRRYAAEAVQALSEWAFSLGIPRVEVRCEPTNLASARTALAAGHSFESYRREEIVVDGRPRDTAVFVRTAADGHLPVPPTFAALPRDGLTDGEITLRPIQASDTAAVIDIESDDSTLEVGFSGVRSDDDELARVCQRAALDWLVGTVARMAVIENASGSCAGTIQLRKVGPPQIAGIGYAVHPSFRGRGYTARALRLITEWAFTDGKFARLELGAKRDNVASQRAALSGGFEPDGVRVARLRNPDGSFSDEVRFALVAPHLR